MDIEQENILSQQDFHSLYTRYNEKFILIANSYLSDTQTAEDIVMDSFMTLWQKSKDTEIATNNIPSYLLGIVKHKCLDELRKQKKHSAQDNIDLIKTEILEKNEFTDCLFSQEIEQILKKELKTMPELTAAVFIANRFDGKTYKEIAQMLGIPTRRVTTEIQKALSILRQSLKDYLPLLILLSSSC